MRDQNIDAIGDAVPCGYTILFCLQTEPPVTEVFCPKQNTDSLYPRHSDVNVIFI